MRKALSLLIAVSMILSLTALPAAVSAVEIEIPTASLAISYDVSNSDGAISDDNMLYPGDQFTVDVNVSSDEAISGITQIDIDVNYDSGKFQFVGGVENTALFTEGETGVIAANSADNIVQYTKTKANLSLEAATPTKILSITYKVLETTPAGTYKVGSTAPTADTVFMVGQLYEISAYMENLTESQANVVVSKSVINVTVVDGDETAAIVDGKTYYNSQGVTVKASGSNIKTATVTGPDSFSEDLKEAGDAGVSVTAAGEYTVTVQANDWAEAESYEFTLSLVDLDATLTMSDFTAKATGYEREEKFTVPVKITGIGDAHAAMVKFNVKFDTDKLTLGEFADTAHITTKPITENEKVVGYEIVYGADGNEDYPVGNNENVAELPFKVAEEAAYGDVTIAIDGTADSLQLVLVSAAIDPENTPIGVSAASKKVTIVPADFIDSINKAGHEAWDGTNTEPYNITVVPAASDATIVYVPVTDANKLTDVENATQTEIAALAGSATAVTAENGEVNISEEGNYYVIVKIGSVYEVTELVNGEDIFIDTTDPVLTAPSDMEGWDNSFTVAKADVSATDDTSGVESIQYTLDDPEAEGTEWVDWDEVSDDGLTVDKTNKTDYGKITIKATDKAGRVTIKTITLKLDVTDPTVTAEAGNFVELEGGGTGKEVSISASDEGGSEINATASVYFSATDLGDEATIADVEGATSKGTVTLEEAEEGYAGTYNAAEAGFYYIVVADGAGNKSFAKVEVKLDKLGAAAKLRVKTVSSDTEFHEGFIPDDGDFVVTDKNGNTIEHNGYFTYVKVEAEAKDGYTSTFTLNGETYDPANAITAASDATAPVEQKLKITTTSDTDELNFAEATYTFYIAKPEHMVSVNGDNRYNIIDYARVRRLVEKSQKMPGADDLFYGGMFSGDVSGNLELDLDDYGAIIDSLRAFEKPGKYYKLPIMNIEEPEVTD